MVLWGSLSPGSVLTSESLRLGELEAISLKCHLCGCPACSYLCVGSRATADLLPRVTFTTPRRPPGSSDWSYVAQVGLDQQTVTLVCTNRRKQFLLDTADVALTE